MNIDDIKKMIQEYFQEGTLTIVGSGLSLAEGIPGMMELAKELQDKIPKELTAEEDKAIWEKIDEDLKGGMGLEESLHNTKPNMMVEESIRKTTANYIGKADLDVFSKVINNEKTLRFSEYLNHFSLRNQSLTVITTNYDRLIEYSCEHEKIMVDTGFVGSYIGRFKPEESKYISCVGVKRQGKISKLQFAPSIKLFKPHGCLSWHLINDIPYSIPSYHVEDSMIITPGLNKYREGYSVPFDIHRAKANEEIDKAQRYIIIGYGFGDDHLETHLMQQLHKGKPTLILTYTLSDKAYELIKKCKNIIAISCEKNEDTKIVTAREDVVLEKINLWDLHEMLKEVF